MISTSGNIGTHLVGLNVIHNVIDIEGFGDFFQFLEASHRRNVDIDHASVTGIDDILQLLRDGFAGGALDLNDVVVNADAIGIGLVILLAVSLVHKLDIHLVILLDPDTLNGTAVDETENVRDSCPLRHILEHDPTMRIRDGGFTAGVLGAPESHEFLRVMKALGNLLRELLTRGEGRSLWVDSATSIARGSRLRRVCRFSRSLV